MLIDWFTVIAQAINFFILVWLLKRYLYQPILHAIDEREQRIAATLADADAKQAVAIQQRDEFQQKNALFNQERAALLNQARIAAEEEKQRLFIEARQSVDDFTAKRLEKLKNDNNLLNQAIMRRTEQSVFSIARKTLADLATASLEQQIAEAFGRRLRGLDAESKAILAGAIKSATEPALLRCAFDLAAEQRALIQQTLNECFATEVPLQFATAADLVGGVEFSCNGRKLAWNIDDYLHMLEQGLDELLTPRAPSGTGAEANE
ncbi:MAG: F0F1 ATP synthase subunit B [Methylomonas sp.]|jgi:F-type H+-transporting ATPase subunit b